MAVSFHLSLPFPFPQPLGFERRNSVSQAEEFLTWSSPHQQSRREAQRTMSHLECMSLCPSQLPQAQPAGLTRHIKLGQASGSNLNLFIILITIIKLINNYCLLSTNSITGTNVPVLYTHQLIPLSQEICYSRYYYLPRHYYIPIYPGRNGSSERVSSFPKIELEVAKLVFKTSMPVDNYTMASSARALQPC